MTLVWTLKTFIRWNNLLTLYLKGSFKYHKYPSTIDQITFSRSIAVTSPELRAIRDIQEISIFKSHPCKLIDIFVVAGR